MNKPEALIAPLIVALVSLCALGGLAATGETMQLRVCGDPNNMPFSNKKLEGIENKVAEIIAKDLGMTVAYTWWPHQRGLVKRVLNTRRCDVMLGIPKGYDRVRWTKPYYRSGYVIAYRKDRGLRVRSLDDPQLKKLRIGVQVNTPPHVALGRRGIAENVVGYQLMFDSNYHPEDYPGKLVDDLIVGEVDVALVWGPVAGYFIKKRAAPLELVVLGENDRAARPADGAQASSPLPFAFDISMGVRKSDVALKGQLEEALARRHDEIQSVLKGFGVPLLSAVADDPSGRGPAGSNARR